MKALIAVIIVGLAVGLGIGLLGDFEVSTAEGYEGRLVATNDDDSYVKILLPGAKDYFNVNPAVLLVAITIALALLYFIVRTLILLVTAPKNTRKNIRSRRERKSREGLQRGLLQLAEGEWVKAEKTLEKSAKHSDIPMLHHLGAARAAQLQNASDRRDQYLMQADASLPKPTHAVFITQAELQTAHGQYEQALATLEHIREDHPRHPYVLRLLAQVYQELGDWDRIAELMPKLKKYSNMRLAELEALEHEIAVQQLTVSNNPLPLNQDLDNPLQQHSDQVRNRWRELSRSQRQDPELRRIYVRELIATDDYTFAAAAIVDGIKKHWDQELVLAYSELPLEDAAHQLKQVQKWIKQHPDDEVALLAAGRLCMKNELWGKARSNFEASIAIKPRRDTYQDLANLYLQLDELELAQQAYQNALNYEGALVEPHTKSNK